MTVKALFGEALQRSFFESNERLKSKLFHDIEPNFNEFVWSSIAKVFKETQVSHVILPQSAAQRFPFFILFSMTYIETMAEFVRKLLHNAFNDKGLSEVDGLRHWKRNQTFSWTLVNGLLKKFHRKPNSFGPALNFPCAATVYYSFLSNESISHAMSVSGTGNSPFTVIEIPKAYSISLWKSFRFVTTYFEDDSESSTYWLV